MEPASLTIFLSLFQIFFLRSGELLAGKHNTNLHYEKVKRERNRPHEVGM
jgi:hypothetical protein